MKLITRETDYAIRALAFIAKKPKEVVTVEELVRRLKIPRSFLRKILQILNKKNILKSNKGQGGGFVLKLKPEKIYLINLMRVFQGPIRLNECIFKKRICPNIKTCNLRKKIIKIQDYVISELRNITLASLL